MTLIYFSYIYSVLQYIFLALRAKEPQVKACSKDLKTAVYQFDEQQSLHITALSCMETSTGHALRHSSSLSPTVLNHTLQKTDLNRGEKIKFSGKHKPTLVCNMSVFTNDNSTPFVAALTGTQELSDSRRHVRGVFGNTIACTYNYVIRTIKCTLFSLNFRRRIKSHLPFAGIIRRLPYSTRFQHKG